MAMTRRRETDGAAQAERGPFDKLGSVADAISRIQPGATVMIGGDLNVGVPGKLLTELVRVRIDQLTVIAAGARTPGRGAWALGRPTRSERWRPKDGPTCWRLRYARTWR